MQQLIRMISLRANTTVPVALAQLSRNIMIDEFNSGLIISPKF